MTVEALLQAVVAIDPGLTIMEQGTNRPTVIVPAATLLHLARALRDTPGLEFDLLVDHTGIDWIGEGRFELVYQLYSMTHGHHLMLSCSVRRDNPVAPSLASVWAIAEWQEREVFDLMGIRYHAHPDLRRLFLDDAWEGYPLRKDYQDDFMITPESEVTP